MHEFSIAVNIVDIAVEHAEKANARRVNEVELEIGELSGVVYEAMETAMEAAIKDTLLEGAEVKIIRIAGRGHCSDCGKEFGLANLFDPCPECGAFNPEVLAGKELRIKSINVD
ncbi:MAG: hydrogenase maturation nickel metallochaperone HypA [Clostridia bacterium]|nr:hydrogenase maturation nickel metallochaperone HypA [Clostridia bacterium]